METTEEKEFFEDLLAILTLPSETTSVLILGHEGAIEPTVFFENFLTTFRDEVGRVHRRRHKPDLLEIGNVYVTLTKHKQVLMRGWDYEVFLDVNHTSICAYNKDEKITWHRSYSIPSAPEVV